MAVRYQAYPEYKDSGVEWLNELPVGWISTTIKYGYEVTLGKMLQKERKSFDDQLKPYLKAINIQEYGVDVSQVEKMWFSPLELDSLGLTHGDVLISEGGDVGRSTIWREELPECYIQNAINRARPKRNQSSSFLFYWMYMLKHSGYVEIICNKATIAHYTVDKLENSPLFIPSDSEAAKIADFLDHETAKIDTLIEKQQQLITLLKEKRQAVISHAVTKGLNPDAPMRDSGVEWLGEVPEHWILKNYRYATQIFRGKFGHRPRNDPAFYDGEYPFIQTGDVAQADKKIKKYKQTLNEKGKNVSEKFPAGTLVMAIAANIGDTAILDFEAYAPDSIVGFKPNNDIELEFLRYSLMAALPALEQISTQSTQANLNIDRIGTVKASFPPIKEQQKIVAQLDKLHEQYSAIEAKALDAIKLMQERRAALISAAVTGKIDVRN